MLYVQGTHVGTKTVIYTSVHSAYKTGFHLQQQIQWNHIGTFKRSKVVT